MRGGMFGLAAALAALPAAAAPEPAQVFTPAQRAAIVEILREALRTDPTILADAIAAMQQAELEAERARGQAAIAAHAEALFRDPGDPWFGAVRPEVTLVEFTDYRCPYCRRMHPVVAELVARDPGVRVVVKEIPILGPASVTAARAALAAHAQGRFAPFHDALMRLRGEPDEAGLVQLAVEVGLDPARFRRDMESAEVMRRLNANLRLAQALGIQGTPAYVVGETLLPGAVPLERLREAVAAARAAR
ncbi:DsbA family protein [Elioraea sp. Yellowstone]|jgi:protein-disulfide isomerase|uniref:DsbA family protein n=1 Tax=Elioraea sp. Yellowstone TaxID=2592070 RepID=UPI00114EBC5B|nr:DsbA family protein [Elioraea sp. Yellowstone]TQF76335.1 DsbA family protein [Elioraea sp. Yellowstone]